MAEPSQMPKTTKSITPDTTKSARSGRGRGSSATPRPSEDTTTPSENNTYLLQRARGIVSEHAMSLEESGSLSNSVNKTRDDVNEVASLMSHLSVYKKGSVQELRYNFDLSMTYLIIKIGSSPLPDNTRGEWINCLNAISRQLQEGSKLVEEEYNKISNARDLLEHCLNEAIKLQEQTSKDRTEYLTQRDEAITEIEILRRYINELKTTDTASEAVKLVAEERDEARIETKVLRRQVDELNTKSNQAVIRIGQVSSKGQSELAKANKKVKALEEKLKVLEEQTPPKQNSRIQQPPSTSARRLTSAYVADSSSLYRGGSASSSYASTSGGTPTPGSGRTTYKGYDSASMQLVHTPSSFESGATKYDGTPSKSDSNLASRRRDISAKTDPFNSTLAVDALAANLPAPSRRIVTESGNATPVQASGESTSPTLESSSPNVETDMIVETTRQGITVVYEMIEAWVKNYTGIPWYAGDMQLMHSHQDLWDYMLNLTYPAKRDDAHAHTQALITDLSCRYWFVFRMMTEYVFNEIINAQAFHGYSVEAEAEMNGITHALEERGMESNKRQALVNQRARLVDSIVTDLNYPYFRRSQLTKHNNQMREMLLPMLNRSSNGNDAGHDLGDITKKAWDLAADMFTMPFTFQIFFPETASKFLESNMIAKDQKELSALDLQLKQTRVKLVISPVVTLRDDRGARIKAKNIVHAAVLTMK